MPLYVRDWLADTEVTAMGAVARAGYLDLLCRCWSDGSIPAPDGTAAKWAALAALARLTSAEIRRVWPVLQPHFVACETDPTRLRNRRLERHRKEIDEHAQRRTESAVKAAQSRWQLHRVGNAKAH